MEMDGVTIMGIASEEKFLLNSFSQCFPNEDKVWFLPGTGGKTKEAPHNHHTLELDTVMLETKRNHRNTSL